MISVSKMGKTKQKICDERDLELKLQKHLVDGKRKYDNNYQIAGKKCWDENECFASVQRSNTL